MIKGNGSTGHCFPEMFAYFSQGGKMHIFSMPYYFRQGEKRMQPNPSLNVTCTLYHGLLVPCYPSWFGHSILSNYVYYWHYNLPSKDLTLLIHFKRYHFLKSVFNIFMCIINLQIWEGRGFVFIILV